MGNSSGGVSETLALLERRRELSRLERMVQRAVAGRGRAVVIEGPGGVGKTALLDALRTMGAEQGMEVLLARGDDLEREFPFSIVRQLLEPRLRAYGADERATLLTGPNQLASSALGLAPDVFADATAPVSVLESLGWLTADLASRRPLLLAIDDADWIDLASLHWLSHLLRRLAELPVLVAATARDPLAPELSAAVPIEVIRPALLSQTAVARLVRDALDEEPEAAFARACREATGGNPFLLRELLTALAAVGARPVAAQVARVGEVTPPSVARAVGLRLLRLPREAQVLAAAAAVLGRAARATLAAAAADLEPVSLPALAAALGDADILVLSGERLEFVHPIVRAAVYERLPPAKRGLLHARAARVLSDAGAPDEEIAAQVLSTPAAGRDWVVKTLRRSARAAVAHGAPDHAARFLRRALAEPPAPAVRSELLRELGAAEIRAGDRGGLEHLRAAERQAPPGRAQGLCALELGLALVAHGRVQDGAEVLTGAIDRLGTSHRGLSMRLEAELLAAARLHTEMCRTLEPRLLRQRGRSLAGVTGSERLMLGVQAMDAAVRGESAAQVAELAVRAVRVDALGGPHLAHSPPLNQGAYALVVADRFDLAGRFYDAALAAARAAGSVVGFATTSCWRSHLAYRRGALREAEADARNALDAAAEADLRLGWPAALAFLADALLERGDLTGAHASIERGLADADPESVLVHALLYARGLLRLAQARPREALADLLDCGERQRRWGATNPAVIPWRSAAATAYAALGQREAAERLVDDEDALARAFGAPRAIGIALRAAGIVKADIASLEASVAVLADSQARLEYARALVELGSARRRTGHRAAAREPLTLGRDIARSCGAWPLEDRARTELLATGARPRRDLLRGVDALTPSELRVAEMAAAGLGNREIATALFVSDRTIEAHLRSTYRKLHIASRNELLTALDATRN